MAGSDTKFVDRRTAAGSGFRPDIEGLRAIAIGLVLLYHSGVKFIPGGFVGVDVFFVISGFLITGLLIREVERTGRVSLPQFWARRAKRLLPASALTLAVTAVAAWFIVPATHWRDFGGDISAAALYVVNWRFAAQAIDYNAEGAGVSPVLHFWSLAVEEQFYIVWPILIVGVVLLARRWRRVPLRTLLTIAISLVVIPSFLWSIAFTSANPDVAFFVTTTRLWELGIGAAVAIGANYWSRIPSPIALILGWLGVAAIAFAALQFSSASAWPGAGALVPTLGAAAMIIATTGREPGKFGVGRALGIRPMVWIGGLSYSLYLWHWPFLVLGAEQFGELGAKKSLLLVAASGVVAWVSLKLVENPIRFSRPVAASNRLALSLGANFTLVGALAGALLVLAIPATTVASSTAAGARFLDTREYQALTTELADIDTVDYLVPAPTDAGRDTPHAQRNGCVTAQDSSEVIVCEYGDPEGQVTIALVGDSKILQWQTVISKIGAAQGWRVLTYFKSACAFTEPLYDLNEENRVHCAEWNLATIDALVELAPDAVITSGRGVFDGTTDNDDHPGAEMIAAWWQRLLDEGVAVIPLLDNPSPSFQVYECAEENREKLSDCAFNKERAVRSSGARYQLLAAKLVGIRDFVDMTDVVCPAVESCPAVVGNVLVYRQGSHLTTTYIDTTETALTDRLVPLVEAATTKS